MKTIGGITITGCLLMAAVCVSRAQNPNSAAPPGTRGAAPQAMSQEQERQIRQQREQMLTLDKTFVAVNATDEQKAQVQKLVKHTGERWRDWLRRNQDQLAKTRDVYHTAAVAGDSEQAEQLKKEYLALVGTLPKCRETWEKAKAIFSADQQAKLNGLKTKSERSVVSELLSGPLHQAVSDESRRSAPSGSNQCGVCHLKHENVAAK
jgi:hypothetical protein